MKKEEFNKAKAHHEQSIANNSHVHGYPVSFISGLISRCEFLEQEKNKWKAVAKARGERLEKISNLAKPIKCDLEEDKS